ncbi:MAG TPA: STAS domain-containing protein [Actinomycetales bacterium]|jgi:anti-anti-sigma factor
MDGGGGDGDTGAVSVFFDETGTLIVLVGDVDRVLSEDLEHAGRDAIDHGQPITIDTSGVTFMDSVGVAFLVRLAAAMPAKDKVVLRDCSVGVMDLLHITGSIPLFRITSAT